MKKRVINLTGVIFEGGACLSSKNEFSYNNNYDAKNNNCLFINVPFLTAYISNDPTLSQNKYLISIFRMNQMNQKLFMNQNKNFCSCYLKDVSN